MEEYVKPEEIAWLHGVRAHVARDMRGIEGIINLLLIALVTRGHVLLEGNPGLGKTALIKALCAAMGFPKDDQGRIQFTPDLMPSDITGTKMPTAEGDLEFQKGPIFCKLLLADEINRATPKTQAAMLEAMAEHQVTVLGQEYTLVHETEQGGKTPFMVMATQNPVEQEGTFELPEAQLDRFLFKAVMPFPHRDTLAEIVEKVTGTWAADEDRPSPPLPEDSLRAMHWLGQGLRRARPSDDVARHILNIVMASVGDFRGMEDVSSANADTLRKLCDDHLRYELGPRAAISLTQAALGWATIAEIKSEESSQIPVKSMQGLARTALPVLRHRMVFEQGYSAEETGKPQEIQDTFVRRFVKLCAPARDGYDASFAVEMDGAAQDARF